MTTPPIPDEPRTAYDVLADLLDLCSVVDREQPVHRSISTRRLRELITTGLADQ